MIQSDILAATIALLRPKFLAALSDRLTLFGNLREALGGPEPTAPMLADLRMGLHKTAGLAATMGFADLGEMSRQLELTLVERGLQSTRPLSPAFLESLDEVMQAMAKACGEMP